MAMRNGDLGGIFEIDPRIVEKHHRINHLSILNYTNTMPRNRVRREEPIRLYDL